MLLENIRNATAEPELVSDIITRPTKQEIEQHEKLLQEYGQTRSIVVVQVREHEGGQEAVDDYKIVAGDLEYLGIYNLKSAGKWTHGEVEVKIISANEQEKYFKTATKQKHYSAFQRALFAVYYHWDDEEKKSKERQEGKKNGKKGKTAEIVGSYAGVKETYTDYAHKIFTFDPRAFEVFYIYRVYISKERIIQLRKLIKSDEKTARIYLESIYQHFTVWKKKNKYLDENVKKKDTIVEQAFAEVEAENKARKVIRNVAGNDEEYQRILKKVMNQAKKSFQEFSWEEAPKPCTARMSTQLPNEAIEFIKDALKSMFNIEFECEFSKVLKDELRLLPQPLSQEEQEVEVILEANEVA